MIKVTGDKEVLKRLEKLRAYAPLVAEESTHRVMDAVQEKAQNILNESIGTGRWGGTWSHGKSYNDRSIEESWEQHKGSWTPIGYIAVLSNESEHASAVEFGVPHKIYPKNSNLLDLGQGTYKPWVRGQRGYHYLSQAISNTDYMLSIYYRDFKTLIKEMTV